MLEGDDAAMSHASASPRGMRNHADSRAATPHAAAPMAGGRNHAARARMVLHAQPRARPAHTHGRPTHPDQKKGLPMMDSSAPVPDDSPAPSSPGSGISPTDATSSAADTAAASTDVAAMLALLDRIAAAQEDTDRRTVAVVGSMNADYTVVTPRLPGPGETVTGGPLRILPGGKSGNQAAAAARIGAHVRMFGAVGSDANAGFLLGHLADAGVDVSQVRHADGPSGTTVITVDGHGENTIVYSPGSNAQVTPEYIAEVRTALAEAAVLGLCLESPMETVVAAARTAHEAGAKVLVNDSPFVPSLPRELVEASDVLLVNEHEMAQLLGVDEPADGDWDGFDWRMVGARMAALGFDEAIVTLGGDGSVVLESGADAGGASVNAGAANDSESGTSTAGDTGAGAEGSDMRIVDGTGAGADGTTSASANVRVTRIAPVKVDAIDTTGCGDAFMGTVLAGLAAGIALRDAARLASIVSAYAATGQGAQASYGTAAQIRARFAV